MSTNAPSWPPMVMLLLKVVVLEAMALPGGGEPTETQVMPLLPGDDMFELVIDRGYCGVGPRDDMCGNGEKGETSTCRDTDVTHYYTKACGRECAMMRCVCDASCQGVTYNRLSKRWKAVTTASTYTKSGSYRCFKKLLTQEAHQPPLECGVDTTSLKESTTRTTTTTTRTTTKAFLYLHAAINQSRVAQSGNAERGTESEGSCLTKSDGGLINDCTRGGREPHQLTPPNTTN